MKKRTFVTDAKFIESPVENYDSHYYLELPDEYRLVYDEDGYVGRYDPNLDGVI